MTPRKLDPTLTGHLGEKLDSDLRSQVIGQDEAIQHIISVYQTYLAGMMDVGRPIGSFLFLGPTGTGKTYLVECACLSLVGDVRAMVKIDCGEFQHSHEIAKLIGSPPGYLGHRETSPLLSQERLSQYHTEKCKISFVLFDEIEKASDSVWNLLLGILDKGTLTLGDNRRVDFTKTMIFMTSNLGSGEMFSLLDPSIGFATSEVERQRRTGKVDAAMNEKIGRAGVEAARRKFKPEFMNRIDKIAVFRPLTRESIRRVLDLELNAVQNRVLSAIAQEPFVFKFTAEAKEFLLREGTDTKYGARNLKRAIDRHVVKPTSNMIVSQQIKNGDVVGVYVNEANDGLDFFKEDEGLGTFEMQKFSQILATCPLATRCQVDGGTQAAAVKTIDTTKSVSAVA